MPLKKRGVAPKNSIAIAWSPNFAYAIGLMASDGSLSANGRSIDFTSKDKVQVENLKKCFGAQNRIGKKSSGSGNISYRIQIGDIVFYQFLASIGITRNKSKTLKSVCVPEQYFFDFLRGVFDGDGSCYSYYDPRWRSSFMFYLAFASASSSFLEWLQGKLNRSIGVSGHITSAKGHSTCQLKFAKSEGLEIIKKMYYTPHVVCLERKRRKIKACLKEARISDAQVAKLVDAPS